MNPINNNIRVVWSKVGQIAEGAGSTKEKSREIGTIVRDLLGHATTTGEKLSSRKFNNVTAHLLKNAAGALPEKERATLEKTIDSAFQLLDQPIERSEIMVRVAIEKMQGKDIREIKAIHQEVSKKLLALMKAHQNNPKIHQFLTDQMEKLSQVVVQNQMGARMADMLKEIAGRKFPVHDELKQQIVEFCKDPERQGTLEFFLSCCEQSKNLLLAGHDDQSLQAIRDRAVEAWVKINQMAAESDLKEIISLANEFRDRFVSMNVQVHTDSMLLRLLVEVPSGTEGRKKAAIESANAERIDHLKLAKTDEEKEAIQKMMGFTNRGKFAWDKAEWVEEIKNPAPDTPFVKGERVITFLSKAPGAVPKEARVPLDLEFLGKLTHKQSLGVFDFINTSESFGMKGKDEDLKAPFEMSPEQFQKLQEIKRNFNTTLLKEMEKVYMTLDE